MAHLDWIIVVTYLAYIIWAGLRASSKKENLDEFLRAGQSLPWWAVGLSVMATQMSAITLIGTTGKAYESGLHFIQFYFGLPLAMIILCFTLVPYFRRENVYTAYEVLEKRFDSRTRTLTSLAFLFSRGLSCGVIIAAPAVVLSIVLGWSHFWTVLAIGIPTIFYTMLGGVRAVTWTDVRQMVLIAIGLTATVVTVISNLPSNAGLSEALTLADASGHLDAIDTSFAMDKTYTIWSGLIGGLFLMLSYFGCDQSQVQRYLAAKSLKESQRSLLMSAVFKIPLQLLILLLGCLVYVAYLFQQPPLLFDPSAESELCENMQSECRELKMLHRNAWLRKQKSANALLALKNKTELAEAKSKYSKLDDTQKLFSEKARGLVAKIRNKENYSDVNFVFPHYILSYMPVGIVGILIASILAAAMSSISSELNALSTTSVIDIYRRHFAPSASDEHYLIFSKVATLFWGLFACAVAYYAASLGALIEVVNKFGSYFYGSILGVFLLAFLSRSANGSGTVLGLIFGILSVAYIDLFSAINISFLWYNVIGTSVVVFVGLGHAILFVDKNED